MRDQPVPKCRLGLVYTGRTPEAVHQLVDDSLTAGFDVRLWALRDIDPTLSELTVGSGQRDRLAIHAELLAGAASDEWLVIADDDVIFKNGRISDFLRVVAAAGLDVAQPAHEPGSRANVRFTRRMPFHAVRETTFVESGPLVALSPRAAPGVVPRLAEYGMGWGIEFLWLELQARGLRLGIVDGVGITHLFWPGSTYTETREAERLQKLIAEHGLSSFDEIQTTTRRLGVWMI